MINPRQGSRFEEKVRICSLPIVSRSLERRLQEHRDRPWWRHRCHHTHRAASRRIARTTRTSSIFTAALEFTSSWAKSDRPDVHLGEVGNALRPPSTKQTKKKEKKRLVKLQASFHNVATNRVRSWDTSVRENKKGAGHWVMFNMVFLSLKDLGKCKLDLVLFFHLPWYFRCLARIYVEDVTGGNAMSVSRLVHQTEHFVASVPFAQVPRGSLGTQSDGCGIRIRQTCRNLHTPCWAGQEAATSPLVGRTGCFVRSHAIVASNVAQAHHRGAEAALQSLRGFHGGRAERLGTALASALGVALSVQGRGPGLQGRG